MVILLVDANGTIHPCDHIILGDGLTVDNFPESRTIRDSLDVTFHHDIVGRVWSDEDAVATANIVATDETGDPRYTTVED